MNKHWDEGRRTRATGKHWDDGLGMRATETRNKHWNDGQGTRASRENLNSNSNSNLKLQLSSKMAMKSVGSLQLDCWGQVAYSPTTRSDSSIKTNV